VNKIRFYRGTAATSRKKAIQTGLSMLNESSRFPGDTQSLPGAFFYVDIASYGIAHAEDHAIDVAKEGKIGCVIDFTLEPRNYRIMQGRIQKVTIGSGRRGIAFDFKMIDLYRNVEDLNGFAAINLLELTHEELIALGIRVGFDRGDGEFEYRSYEEWANLLEVRNETREGLPDVLRFGRQRPWRC
jgi:hypothetical protein